MPSICTVQAPHRPAPQPNFVPVSLRCSRTTQSSGVFGVGIDARGFAIDRKGNRRHEYLPFVRCSCGYGLRIVCSALLESGAVFERPHIGRIAIIRRGILEALQA